MSLLNFFSMNKKWFRHSDYEIINYPSKKIKETNLNMLAIKPTKQSKIKWYNPFNVFPNILQDFFELLNKINILDENIENDIEKKEETDVFSLKRAQIFLNFIKKYGPFGLYWEEFSNQNSFNDSSNYFFKDKNKSFVENLNNKYFPTHNKRIFSYFSFGTLVDNNLSNEPRGDILHLEEEAHTTNLQASEYIESVYSIEKNSIFIRLKNHYLDWQKGQVDNIEFQNIEIGLSTEKATKISWGFKSLLSSLKIMYILNIVGNAGENKIKPCKRKDCQNYFLVGPTGKKIGSKYCSDSCGSVVRTRRSRHRNK